MVDVGCVYVEGAMVDIGWVKALKWLAQVAGAPVDEQGEDASGEIVQMRIRGVVAAGAVLPASGVKHVVVPGGLLAWLA